MLALQQCTHKISALSRCLLQSEAAITSSSWRQLGIRARGSLANEAAESIDSDRPVSPGNTQQTARQAAELQTTALQCNFHSQHSSCEPCDRQDLPCARSAGQSQQNVPALSISPRKLSWAWGASRQISSTAATSAQPHIQEPSKNELEAQQSNQPVVQPSPATQLQVAFTHALQGTYLRQRVYPSLIGDSSQCCANFHHYTCQLHVHQQLLGSIQ